LLPSCSAGRLPTKCTDNQRESRGGSCRNHRKYARPLTDTDSTAISATHALPRPYAEDLDTPCVIVDLARLERNIAEMAALAYEAQVARRLAALAARPGLSVSSIADSYQGIAALSAAFVGADEPLETLVKVNTGLGRVGVAPGAATVDLARSVAAAPGLRFGGVCAHEGFTYGLPGPDERAAAARWG
jgi:D-serine deaminase-like pyridoxal phosphate-dependent protein